MTTNDEASTPEGVERPAAAKEDVEPRPDETREAPAEESVAEEAPPEKVAAPEESPPPTTPKQAGGVVERLRALGPAKAWSKAKEKLVTLEDRALALVPLAIAWIVWPAVFAMAIAAAWWIYRAPPELQAILDTNKSIKFDDRYRVAMMAVRVFFGILGAHAVAVFARRLIKKEWQLLGTAHGMNGGFCWLVALPLVAVFVRTSPEATTPIWTVLLSMVAAVMVGVSVYAIPTPTREPPRWFRFVRYGAPVVVVGLLAFYAWRFSDLAVMNHHAMNTRTIDLGYYDNIFYQSIHGRPLGCTFMHGENHSSGHFDPILVLLSPLYLIYPRAELLLVLQSVWLATGVIPLYLLVKHILASRGAALVLCAVWVMYPAMHGANMYEFHSLTLIAPLMLWLLYFLESRRFKSYAVMLVVLWLCREDIPLLTFFVGLYAVLRREAGFGRAGWLTMGWSLVYFVIVKKVFMASEEVLNQGEGAYGFSYYFADLIPENKGLTELLLSILQNPLFALHHAFGNPDKILYLLVLFAPLAFLPFYAKGLRLVLVYGLFIVLAASRKPVFQPHFQYSCLIFPIAFAAVPLALRRVRDNGDLFARLGLRSDRLVRGLLGFVLAATLLISWKFGGIVENKSFRGGFGRIARELKPEDVERFEAVERMKTHIEPWASVLVSNQMGPHVTARAKVYLDRQKKQTDYVFVNERELKDALLAWHQERVKAGGLLEVDVYKTIKLFRAVPERDITWQQFQEIQKKRSPAKKK